MSDSQETGLAPVVLAGLLFLGMAGMAGNSGACAATVSAQIVAATQDTGGQDCGSNGGGNGGTRNGDSECGPRPRNVGKFTKHAKERMQQRGISEDQVRETIRSQNSRVSTGNTECTWKVSQNGVTVIISDTGNVVSVWPG